MSLLSETIAAQGELLAPILEAPIDDAVERIEPARRLHLVGTGTSQHAAELGALMFAPGDRDVWWSSAAAFSTPLGPEDAVVVISHTTETAFARRTRERVLAAGAALVSITGRERGWPEAIETVPAERSETYTASYLAALLVLARLAAATGPTAFDSGRLGDLPGLVTSAASEPPLMTAAPPRLIVLAGAGPAAVTAREGALKLRESARLPAEGYEAEYLLHGSAVPLGPDDALILVSPAADTSGLVQSLGAAAAEEGLDVVTAEEPRELDPLLAQLPLTVRLQVLAAHLAQVRGQDPDVVIEGAWGRTALWEAGAP
ncbi:MAG: SIS domain-containing protein [Solirubrobacteraceae bacterium]